MNCASVAAAGVKLPKAGSKGRYKQVQVHSTVLPAQPVKKREQDETTHTHTLIVMPLVPYIVKCIFVLKSYKLKLNLH